MSAPDPIQQLEHLHAQAASSWVQALREPNPEQRAAFVVWLKESPRNVRDFLLMLSLDRELDHLDSKHLLDIKTLWAQVDRQILSFPKQAQPKEDSQVWQLRWRWAGLAAAFVAVAVTGWLVLVQRGADWKEYQTATGEQRAFELDDGSVIHLDARSRVSIQLSHRARNVRLLEGQALFRVHHDAGRPFRVYAKDAVIQDVGTEFNVYNREDDTSIAVIEGQVSVTVQTPSMSSGQQDGMRAASRTLAANDEALVNRSGTITVRTVADIADIVAWRQRRLVFQRQTLAHIVEGFNKYSHQPIRLEGPSVMNRVYSGVFSADDPDSLIEVLARDPDLIVEKSAQGILVRSR
jgi:transmembrane sensor